MDRRQFLGMTAVAMGGAIYSRALLAFMGGEEKPIILRDSYIDQIITTFSLAERHFVAAAVETIIPKTDTPGALEAGVPKFVELIFTEWMTEGERKEFLLGLSEVEKKSMNMYQLSLAECSPKQRQEVLEAIEDQYQDDPWYELGGQSAFETGAPFIAVIKELTIFGFFTSEVGSTQVLRINHMPGSFQGDIPLDPDDSTWAAVPLM